MRAVIIMFSRIGQIRKLILYNWFRFEISKYIYIQSYIRIYINRFVLRERKKIQYLNYWFSKYQLIYNCWYDMLPRSTSPRCSCHNLPFCSHADFNVTPIRAGLYWHAISLSPPAWFVAVAAVLHVYPVKDR